MNEKPAPDIKKPLDAGGAAAELKLRLTLRSDLPSWCRHNGFEPARHHLLILDKLREVAEGKVDRLAIFMPPGSAKSTYASVLFPPWYLAQRPRDMLISASHTVELAEKWGRRVRGIINENASILDFDIASQSQAAGRWETTKGGEYYAVGVGGAVAGWRGDLVLIDDPLRGREDAESLTIRDKHWDWYRSDIIPRLKPHGRIVLIQTRWHEDDLAGRILDQERSEWEVLSLPAVAEEDDPLGRAVGQALWPEWENLDLLERKRRDVGARNWTSLYQQRPAPEEGDYFRSEWIKPCKELPDITTLRTYGGSDYAVTDNGGDYTVHAVVGIDPGGRMFLCDIWRARAASDRWVEAFCDLVLRWKPMGWAEEQGQIRSGIGPYLDRRQRERKAYVARDVFPTRGDKQIRAQSMRGRMALEGLYVPEFAPWWPALRAELLSFPNGAHDDQVDALGLVGQLLDVMLTGTPAPVPYLRVVGSGYRPIRAASPPPGDWVSY